MSFPGQVFARNMETDLLSRLQRTLHDDYYISRFRLEVPLEWTQTLIAETVPATKTLESMYTNSFFRDIGLSESLWSQLDSNEQSVLIANVKVLISINACKAISDMGVGALAQRLRSRMAQDTANSTSDPRSVVSALLDTMFEDKENTINTIKCIMNPGGMQKMLGQLRLVAGNNGTNSPFNDTIEAIDNVFAGLDMDESSQDEVLDMVDNLTPFDIETMKTMASQSIP